MAVDSTIASRHLLGTDGLQAKPESKDALVRLVVSPEWANTTAGQLMTSCLVNLLSRQVELVEEIEVISSSVPSLTRALSSGWAPTFPENLRDLGAWTVGMTVTVGSSSTGRDAAHSIFIGTPDPTSPSLEPDSIVCIAEGWKAWIGDWDTAPNLPPPTSTNPLGPLLAAALAAGEVFKRTWGIRRGRLLRGDGYSLWSSASKTSWNDLDDGPEVGALMLPILYIVGAGAVGNALVYVLAKFESATGYVIPIDDDTYNTTNLNRCLLAGLFEAKLAAPKVAVMATALRAAGIEAFPFRGTIKEFLRDPRVGLREDVASSVGEGQFNVVVSCVDNGDARQDIQGLNPSLLLGGSTLDLQAKTNFYGGEPGAACLGCFNPREKQVVAVRELEQRLRSMNASERTSFLNEQNVDAAAVEEYLMNPQCGHLGAAAIQDLAIIPTEQFSVGFVSLGSGVLLAANLIREITQSVKSAESSITTINFLNGGIWHSTSPSDDSCEIGGHSTSP